MALGRVLQLRRPHGRGVDGGIRRGGIGSNSTAGLQRIILGFQIHGFISQLQRRQQQHTRFAELNAHGLERRDALINLSRHVRQVLFLTILAGHRMSIAANADRDLRHQP